MNWGEFRSDRLHRGAASFAGPRRRTQSSARCPQTGWRDASHGVCAVRTDRHLYAAGVLPSARHSADRCRDPGSRSRALKALPPDHPLETLLREAPDFRQEAALADALLHPQDRAYSVPQLFEFLAAGGLRFGRWMRQAPYMPHCGVMAKIPQAARLASFPRHEQYAAVELFRGTMVRHSVVAYRDDSPGRLCSRSVLPATPGLAMCPFAWPRRFAFKRSFRPARPRC